VGLFCVLASMPLASSFWGLLCLCVLLALGGGLALPSVSALVVEEGRVVGMATAMALFGMAFSMGMTVGPLTAGVLADALSLQGAFYLVGLLGFLGTAVFYLLARRTSLP